MLPDVLPEFADLSETLRLIDVPEVTGGKVLRVLMNAELNEAVAMLTEPRHEAEAPERPAGEAERHAEPYWAWRLRMVEHLASQVDPERFGVAAMYVFGSTKNATAGLKSDIDLLVHVRGSERQLEELRLWLEGWSLCLDEMNYLRTGYRTGGLLDVHFVTDADIAQRTSYAVKIGAATDPARQLALGRAA